MIRTRLYEPADDEVIYHYCPPEAFLEILTSRTLRFSASYTLNDVSERSWGHSMFEKAAKTLEDETGSEFITKISEPVTAGYLHAMLMIGCFSIDGDVLGQWRAYAHDGRGFAIGFAPTLMQIPAKPLRVLYDANAQMQELVENLKQVYNVEKANGFKYDDEFVSHLWLMGLDLCAYKDPAFREEQEVRFAHCCGIIPSGKSKKIMPVGARDPTTGKRLSKPLKTQFRMRNGLLVPYVIVDYSRKGAVDPIKEIVLGPQNENNEQNIEIFLSSIGVDNAVVRRSKAPYRT